VGPRELESLTSTCQGRTFQLHTRTLDANKELVGFGMGSVWVRRAKPAGNWVRLGRILSS